MIKNHPRKHGWGGRTARIASAISRRFSWDPLVGNASDSPDMVFIWVPKTAGTSVFTFLNERVGMQKLKTAKQAMSFANRGAVTFGHLHYLSLLEAGIVSREFHGRAFKFAFARNPYSRVASLYNYLRQRDLVDGQCFDHFLDRIHLRPPIGLYNVANLSVANPMTDWLMGADGKLLVDKTFKLEEMDEFARHLETHYNLRFDVEEQHNKSVQMISSKDVTSVAERTEKVNRIYARDFELLGYEMIDPYDHSHNHVTRDLKGKLQRK
jgi:hypothetical protein